MASNQLTTIYLLHGKAAGPGGSVLLLEELLRKSYLEVRYVRPSFLMGGRTACRRPSARSIICGRSQSSRVRWWSASAWAGLVAARLQEEGREDLRVICNQLADLGRWRHRRTKRAEPLGPLFVSGLSYRRKNGPMAAPCRGLRPPLADPRHGRAPGMPKSLDRGLLQWTRRRRRSRRRSSCWLIDVSPRPTKVSSTVSDPTEIISDIVARFGGVESGIPGG